MGLGLGLGLGGRARVSVRVRGSPNQVLARPIELFRSERARSERDKAQGRRVRGPLGELAPVADGQGWQRLGRVRVRVRVTVSVRGRVRVRVRVRARARARARARVGIPGWHPCIGARSRLFCPGAHLWLLGLG